MRLKPFQLERWLQTPCEIDIASAGITKLKLRDISPPLDPDMVLGYGITSGSEELRTLIAALYPNTRSEQVLVTTGAAEANLLALQRLIEPGDEVVALMPSYLQCAGLAEALGAVVKPCLLRAEEKYALDGRELGKLVTKRTKLICCVNPNNPTGSVISRAEMTAICEAAERVGAWVLCDGALRLLELDGGPAPSPREWYDRGAATGSLSKAGLTGLRIGWLVAREDLIEQCWADKDYTTLCHSGIGEHLAIRALQKDTYDRCLARARRIMSEQIAIVSRWIQEHREHAAWVPPTAGHTGFVSLRSAMGSEELARRLLEEDNVLVSPGEYFGCAGFLRVRHSGERGELEEALRRLGSFLARHR